MGSLLRYKIASVTGTIVLGIALVNKNWTQN